MWLKRKFACGLLVLFCCETSRAGDWPQFRGPESNGVVDKIEHPLEWGPDRNIGWKVAVPGAGWSSPIVNGPNIFVTTAVSPKLLKPKNMSAGVRDLRSMGFGAKVEDAVLKFEVHCLDLETGSTKWSKVVAERKPVIPIHPSNTHATESPVTDGENIYAYFGTVGIVASLDASGGIRWSREVGAFPMTAGLGPGSSLTIGPELLYVACDNEKQSFVLALNRNTGEDVWKAESAGKTSWATPLLWKNRARSELVCCSGKLVTSYEPASGSVLWTLGKLDSGFSASPASDDDRVYFGGAAPGTAAMLYAVKAGAEGDIALAPKETSNTWVAWSGKQFAPGMASPISLGKELYVFNDFLNCHDAETGKRLYRQRLPGAKTFAASPWADDGKLFIIDEIGQTFVVQTGKKFNLIGVNKLSDTDTFWSTPSVSGPSLLIRGVEFLYCIRERSPK